MAVRNRFNSKVGGVLLIALVLASAFLIFLIKTKEFAFLTSHEKGQVQPFPIGVDPLRESIAEHPDLAAYYERHISKKSSDTKSAHWIDHAVAKLALFDWYQNLASPLSRILVILPGERKEEIADNFSDILDWDSAMQQEFLLRIASSAPALSEGAFFPGRYIADKDAQPHEIADMLNSRFESQVRARYTSDIEKLVPLQDALIIASLLEREAYDFEDMRHIAGVIWNRLFIDMKLQLDATLQYAKGSDPKEPAWWPPVRPDDKYIDSPFNTYQNEGLPPAPISNPSVEAIVAALNPSKTECMFYFHDRNGAFYCTKTYEEHVALLREHYGSGK